LECWGLRSNDDDERKQDLNFDVNFRDLRMGGLVFPGGNNGDAPVLSSVME